MAEPFPVCHLNGELLPLREARISPFDRAFLFADGVYEVLPVYAGRPFRFDSHLERLEHSCHEIRLRNPHASAAWRELCADLLRANAIGMGGEDAYLYLQLSRGAEIGRNHAPLPDLAPTVFAFVAPWPKRSPEVRSRGVSGITTADIRWGRCDIKSVALLANILARDLAAEAGAAEAILLRNGMLTEASASSVHVVIAGEVRTPPRSAQLLPGTTRSALEEILVTLDIPHAAMPVSEAELRAADEIWLGAATRELDAVTELDRRPVGSGSPGPLWQRVDAEFQSVKRRLRGTPW